MLVLVLDWIQCLPQGVGAPSAMIRGLMRRLDSQKKYGWSGLRRLWRTNHVQAVSAWCCCCCCLPCETYGKNGVTPIFRLQTTQPTSGGAVTADSSCCANCVEPPRPQQWGPDLPFFGHAGHADPLDGWRCCSQKRMMSRPIQVRQL